MPFEIAQRMRNVIAQLIPPEFSQKNLPGERQAESGQELPGEQQAEFGQDLPGERQARATLEEIEGDPDLALLKGAQDTQEGKRHPVTEALLDSGDDLLDPSRVRLFGVPFLSLKLAPEDLRRYRYSNKLLQQKILQQDACLARIYAYSYEGHYYKLIKPYVFMVHGPGRTRLENKPASVENWGMEGKRFHFADDTRVWEMDKDDLTLRIDVVPGFLSSILLNAELGARASG